MMSTLEAGEGSGFNLTKAHSAVYRLDECCRRIYDPAKRWPGWWKDWRHVGLVEFVSQHLDLAMEWQAKLPLAVIVLVRHRGKEKTTLLFDGRLWASDAAAAKRIGIVCWLMEKERGKLKRQFIDLAQIPRIDA